MRFKITWKTDTAVLLEIGAEQKELDKYKEKVLRHLQAELKAPGFRKGHMPLDLVEKTADQQHLQNDFLDEAMTALYSAAARSEKLRPIATPKVTIKKFVPFTALEFDAEATVVGKITLPDYKKIKVAKPDAKVSAKDVSEVIENLRTRAAEKIDAARPAKDTDQIWIDFEGFDQKGQPIERADGKDYPLVLGSNTFIPGFEPALVGLKAGDTKEFTVTFPKDYGVSTMKGKKVTFKVKVSKVQEVVKPKADDAFAASMGSFKTLEQLKGDIQKQLQADKDEAARREHEAATLKAITDKTKIALPEELVEEQIGLLVKEVRQNAIQRGQTYEEQLKAEGKTEEDFKKDVLRPEAIDRVRAGLVLSEIAENEKITVEKDELDARISALKAQYNDDKMRAELDKVENQREIASRILTEKTIRFLTQ
jgi:trigger factor